MVRSEKFVSTTLQQWPHKWPRRMIPKYLKLEVLFKITILRFLCVYHVRKSCASWRFRHFYASWRFRHFCAARRFRSFRASWRFLDFLCSCQNISVLKFEFKVTFSWYIILILHSLKFKSCLRLNRASISKSCYTLSFKELWNMGENWTMVIPPQWS